MSSGISTRTTASRTSSNYGAARTSLSAAAFSALDLQVYSFAAGQYRELIKILEGHTGFDLWGYRESVAKRRIWRRARATGRESVAEYIGLLKRDKEEAERLFDQVTIHVSHFFRNPRVFEALGSEIMSAVFESAGEGEGVTFWSAGCAQGEEAYSLALLLLKKYAHRLSGHPTRIIATDINRRSLEKARMGRYEENKVALVDESLKKSYFRYSGGQWELKRWARGCVSFRLESLFTGEGAPGAAIILARNLLIYFNRDKQQAMLQKLVNDLKPGGYLVLGKSETLPLQWRRQLRPVAPLLRIYRKIAI